VGAERDAERLWVRTDSTMAVVMLAGLCTFLNVYPTQPLIPCSRPGKQLHGEEAEIAGD